MPRLRLYIIFYINGCVRVCLCEQRYTVIYFIMGCFKWSIVKKNLDKRIIFSLCGKVRRQKKNHNIVLDYIWKIETVLCETKTFTLKYTRLNRKLRKRYSKNRKNIRNATLFHLCVLRRMEWRIRTFCQLLAMKFRCWTDRHRPICCCCCCFFSFGGKSINMRTEHCRRRMGIDLLV